MSMDPTDTPTGLPLAAEPRRSGARAALSRPLILAGIGGACALGLVLGLAARPQLAPDSRTPGSMQPVNGMQIEIDRDEPLPAVEGGKLELLPAGLRPPKPAAPVVEPPPIRQAQATQAPVRPAARGPSFECEGAGSVAETLVCDDPALAAQDRRLASAWRRALDSGLPAWRLRRQQQRWLAAREDAAREAPEAVSDLYDQRIRELEDEADMADPDR